MADVHIEQVSKIFKEMVAVDDVSLTVDEGEFFSLLGPSGCGKTTTLRMIGGFEEPTRGTIYLGGQDVTGLPPYRRDVNTVFQSYALFPHLDVFENVAFGLKRKKAFDQESIRRQVNEMLDLVDLSGFGARRINQLSGGQQQRVALARALVNGPEVLLLDEPLGALDLKLRKQMQVELKRIQSELKITFVYVTHDQEEAMTMSNRIAVMRAGRFEQIGVPQEVYERPATEFVASFLGASNFLEGTVDSRDGTVAKVALAAGGAITLPASRLPAASGDIRIGVRPEKLYIQPADGSEADAATNAIQASVSISTYTGVSTFYECTTPDGATVVVYAQNLGSAADPLAPGTKVRLTWHPEHTFAVPGSNTREQAGGNT
jgi:spermidine/putrescine transport system ATP-binding protein